MQQATPETLFLAMIAESDRHALPRSFPGDMVHDQRKLCAEGVPQLFGWVLYESGSHWCTPERLRAPGRRKRGDWDDLLETIRTNCTGARYYLGGPDGLREVPFVAFAAAMRGEGGAS